MKGDNKKVSFKFVWGLVMVVTYLLIAYLLVFSTVFIERSTLPEVVRIILAIIFAVYGTFRGYRLWKQL